MSVVNKCPSCKSVQAPRQQYCCVCGQDLSETHVEQSITLGELYQHVADLIRCMSIDSEVTYEVRAGIEWIKVQEENGEMGRISLTCWRDK
jgi:hypothetical protein